MESRESSCRWLAALLLVLLVTGCNSLAPLTGASALSTISGRVSTASGPIPDAAVELTVYQHDRCVALARSTSPPSDQEQQALTACTSKLGTTHTNEAGTYVFPNVRPGSYDLKITWTLRQDEPVPPIPVFEQGDYVIVIVSKSDGTWTVTAVSEIVTLSSQQGVVKDFTFRPPTP
jgi:hypothetical protein